MILRQYLLRIFGQQNFHTAFVQYPPWHDHPVLEVAVLSNERRQSHSDFENKEEGRESH